MRTYIIFHLDHPYFIEPLRIRVEWKCLFLPRIGESINAWIWIEEAEISKEKVECLLSEEGRKSYNDEFRNNSTLNDWLYELGMECDTVYSISYYKENSDPHNIYVQMYLNDTGVYHR